MKRLAVCAILMFAANASWASNLVISDSSFENYAAGAYTYSSSFSESFVDDVSIAASASPEPATFVLIGGALLGLGLVRRRRA